MRNIFYALGVSAESRSKTGYYYIVTILSFHANVFPSKWLELSPSLKYNSRDLFISSMLKLLYLTSFSEVFTIHSSVLLLKNHIVDCFK